MKTAALSTALFAALAAASPIDARKASGCKAVTVLFARGTTEMGTLGTVVGPGLQKALQSALGADSVTFEGVSYPADSFGISAEGVGSGPGSKAMTSQASEWLSKCPETKLVLTGYSQGAMVVHNAAKMLNGKDVLAAVTFGDPFKSQPVSGISKGDFKSFCGVGDFVCSVGGCASAGGCESKSQMGHLGYFSDNDAAAAFIKSVAA
ncbi:cutinase [Colletotrichum graminicola]|uniref:cutinase n=1 Tax=Colletotrichum graminicola (strain M1.001 / M2 / FGSC 10212) TaxID=645133 RepID=E3QWT6_COLGM|nr:cutinase [Colletotrichum graminicola M1.001]EFQ35324.1 cutinase [Colletotrichum graminicola M1.001]WDK22096.1 cutinase [Colletotrichum graminicola]